MKRKGISLIVLIITCVVIIILATAIIVNIAQTNMIENAKEAVVKQDFKTMQDELTLYIADNYADTLGKFKSEDLKVTEKTDIAKIIPSIVGTEYEEYVVIEDGNIAISEDMPEKERKWAMEALGLIKTSTNRPTESKPEEPEPTATPVVAINTIVENENATITGRDFAYNNPVIPVGFKAINTEKASWEDVDKDGLPDGWNDGLVIKDESKNEFVWVPVDGTNVTYAKYCTVGIAHDNASISNDLDALPTVAELSIDETSQITKYGGFYIGRYEAGVPDKINLPSINTVGIPTVQKNAKVWTNIYYQNAKVSAKKMYESSSAVKSGIVTGTQWDTLMKWIEKSGIDVTDSKSWGNYSNTIGNAQYDIDETTKISGKIQASGRSEYWKAKNIYDLAGNTNEWSSEKYSSYRICRGGSVITDYRASGRFTATPSGLSYESYNNISFRVVLYVI